MTKRDELIALGGVGVKLKPLEWPPRCPRGQRVHNRPALVNYTVAHYGGDVGDAIYRWAEAHSPWSDPLPTYEAAKAAAQADYERRILSALEAPAAGDGEPVAWRWQEEDWGDYWIYNPEPGWLAEQNNIVKQPLFTAPPADAGMREALGWLLDAIKQEVKFTDATPLLKRRFEVAEQALTAPGATTNRSEVTASLEGDAVERVAGLLRKFHRDSCYPEAMAGELNAAVNAVLATGLVAGEAAIRGDWHTTGWDRARNSGRILLVWSEFAGVREHIELGWYSDSKAAWVNTYGHPFHGEPDGWAPLLPFKTAETIRADEREKCAPAVSRFEERVNKYVTQLNATGQADLAHLLRRDSDALLAAIRSGDVA